jgi:hypothetical protein
MAGKRRYSERTKLKRLADFAERFRAPGASFGQWSSMTGEGTSENPYQMPYFCMSDLRSSFFDMAYESGWVLEWSWVEWAHGPEGQALVNDRAALANADPDQLAKLLTALIRQERLVEGALGSAFEAGLLLAIAERAREILRINLKTAGT